MRQRMTHFGCWHGIVLMAKEKRKKKARRCLKGRPHTINQSYNRKYINLWQVSSNMCDVCTFQNKCMVRCLSIWFPDTFIHQSRRPVGAEKKETAVRLAARQKPSHSLKNKKFSIQDRSMDSLPEVYSRTQYINSAWAIEQSNGRCRTWH